MFERIKQSRQARWAVPGSALVIVGGVLAGSLISVAQASPALPARTPAQLLAEVAATPSVPPLTGTVVETASLGLPQLPDTGSPTSLASLLTGSHTIKVWYSDATHYRLSVPASMSESDVIRDGSSAWLWQSSSNSVTQFKLSAHESTPSAQVPLTPQQAASEVLAKVGPTTTVKVATNATVAGEPAYELVLAPKDSRSLVGQVDIAIDAKYEVPLRVQVYARGATSPAFQVGFTSISFVKPASANVSFTPPAGAKVTQGDLGGKGKSSGSATNSSVTGKDWLTVAELPESEISSGTASGPSSGGESSAVVNALLHSGTAVRGAWGSGTLLRTSLFSLLVTNGHVYFGAVDPSVLYTAATTAK
jgi:outer membrane lipoprotein-sorting protein